MSSNSTLSAAMICVGARCTVMSPFTLRMSGSLLARLWMEFLAGAARRALAPLGLVAPWISRVG